MSAVVKPLHRTDIALPTTGGAGAFKAMFDASPAQIADLTAFQARLVEANSRMNLVGPSASADFWGRHVWDSAQLLHVEHSALTWADIGAGAGFPGLVLAILLKGREGAQVHLVESMAKRVRFLSETGQALGLPTVMHHARAETMSPPRVDIVTARACAPLPRLLDYTHRFFQAGARGLFLKGRGVEEELTEARRSWTFEADLIPSRSDPSGRLVRIERLAPRGR